MRWDCDVVGWRGRGMDGMLGFFVSGEGAALLFLPPPTWLFMKQPWRPERNHARLIARASTASPLVSITCHRVHHLSLRSSTPALRTITAQSVLPHRCAAATAAPWAPPSSRCCVGRPRRPAGNRSTERRARLGTQRRRWRRSRRRRLLPPSSSSPARRGAAAAGGRPPRPHQHQHHSRSTDTSSTAATRKSPRPKAPPPPPPKAS